MAAYKIEMEAQELAVRTVLFVIGGTVVHSAACVINDICDVDFDRQVGKSNRNNAFFLAQSASITERTKNRPLAAGLISVYGAWVLLAVLVFGCFFFLHLVSSTAYALDITPCYPFGY